MMRDWFGRWGVMLLVALVAARPSAASSAEVREDCVEWRFEASELVVRGTVRPGMQRDLTLEGAALREVTLDVKEVFKGADAAGETVQFFMDASEPLAGATRSWEDVLVFLNRADGEVRANVASVRLGGWRAPAGWVFVLGAERLRPVLQMDGTYVRDAAALLSLVRSSAAFAKGRGGATKVEPAAVPLDATAWDAGGSYVLVAPKDVRLEAVARRWLGDRSPDKRARGLAVIGTMPSAANAMMVRTLLADSFGVERSADEWRAALDERWWREYPLRRRAGKVLATWNELHGVRVDATVADLRYGPVRWGWAWGLAVLAIGGVALAWPRCKWGRPGGGARLAVVMVGLMVLAVVARPHGRQADAYSVATPEADYEVISGGGRVALLRVQDDAPVHGWRVWRTAIPQTGDALWFTRLLSPVESFDRWDVRGAEGRTRGRAAYSYRLVDLPFWMAPTALAVWPVVWMVGALRRRGRRRAWVKANRCGRCGYDLRGHRIDEGCPECGEGR